MSGDISGGNVTRPESLASRLARAVADGTITRAEASALWAADGWLPPDGVRAGFGGRHGVRLLADGRRKPIIGRYVRLDAEVIIWPQNRGSNRPADLALLDGVAQVLGQRATVRLEGRPHGPSGHGVTDDDRRRIVAEMTTEVRRHTVPVAAELVGRRVGWSARTVADVFRAGNRRGDQ